MSLLRSKRFLAIAFIACAGILVYANTLRNGMFWDDNDWILNNTSVHTFAVGKFFSQNVIAGAGLESDYWRPVLDIVFGTEWALWGPWAPGYHAVNTAVHIANAIFVFLIFFALFKKYWVSFFTALVFLLHPLQTEAVSYVSGLGDPLSFLFMLLAVFWYLRMHDPARSEQSRAVLYLAALAMFPLAVMSKERSLILPGFLLLIDLWFWVKECTPCKATLREIALRIAPFAVLAAIYLVLRGTVLNFHDTFNIYGVASYYTTHITARIFTFLKTVPLYLGLFFAPVTLFMERSMDFTIATSLGDPAVLTGLVILLLMLAIAVFAYTKRRPEYAFAALWFLIGIFPASGIAIPVAGLVYEHYMYISVIGLGLFLALFARDLLAWHNGAALKVSVVAALSAWLTFLGIRSVVRNEDWRDPVTFFTQTLAHEPTSMRAWNDLGMAYADSGDITKARNAYNRAIALDPQNAVPYYNLGNTYANTDKKTAERYWQEALTLNPKFLPANLRLEHSL